MSVKKIPFLFYICFFSVCFAVNASPTINWDSKPETEEGGSYQKGLELLLFGLGWTSRQARNQHSSSLDLVEFQSSEIYKFEEVLQGLGYVEFQVRKIQEAEEVQEDHSWMMSPEVHWNCFPASEPLMASLEDFEESETVAFELENSVKLASLHYFSQKKDEKPTVSTPPIPWVFFVIGGKVCQQVP